MKAKESAARSTTTLCINVKTLRRSLSGSNLLCALLSNTELLFWEVAQAMRAHCISSCHVLL